MPIDYKKYHPDWRQISKLIRFGRANFRCERCGAIHFQPHPMTGSKVVLATAHLDQDVSNNQSDNLAALCQRCHLLCDQKHNLLKRKYGKEWQKWQLKLW